MLFHCLFLDIVFFSIFLLFFYKVEERADLILKERAESMTQQNTDFGHVTYEQTCMKLGIPPRLKIIHQLFLTRMQLNHCGLNAAEAKALGLALQVYEQKY